MLRNAHHGTADPDSRKRSRDMDIAESYYLLLELGTQEPVLQHCIKTLQGICLSQGVKLAKKGAHDQDPETRQWSTQATTEFQDHIDRFWVPFCEEALRMFYVCGFVPWHVRRVPSTGDLVPEVLPLGTFTWCVELRTEKERRRDMLAKSRGGGGDSTRISYLPAVVDDKRKGKEWHNPVESGGGRLYGDSATKTLSSRAEIGDPEGSRRVRMDSETKYVQYRVTIKDGGLHEDEVYIYDFVPAKYEISMNSMMYATVPSPLSHLLVDYKNLRQAQIRRSHADSWNTQAHLITTYKPGNGSNNIPEWKGFNYGPHDLDTRVPAADGNPLTLLFDTNGTFHVEAGPFKTHTHTRGFFFLQVRWRSMGGTPS